MEGHESVGQGLGLGFRVRVGVRRLLPVSLQALQLASQLGLGFRVRV